MKRSLICFCVLIGLNDAAFTQALKVKPGFYIILDSLSKKCAVVDKMPQTDTPNITVASDAIYPTRTEAEDAMKKMKPCSNNIKMTPL
jgi:hypothetical protein